MLSVDVGIYILIIYCVVAILLQAYIVPRVVYMHRLGYIWPSSQQPITSFLDPSKVFFFTDW